MNRKAVIGILAHVDSGKTTLSEAMLYKSGAIRKLGRVDHKDAFLDNNPIERDRGITIFSKQAVFEYGGVGFTLLDTPGHVDFSGETERTLRVIDAAILVISGTDGVQPHTKTLARLLERYDIPTFIFVNKMDMDGARKDFVMNSVTAAMGDRCVSFAQPADDLTEALSLCSEEMMEEYLEKGEISDSNIISAIAQRRLIPVCFGSALSLEGIEALLECISKYIPLPEERTEFGAKVYKITEDNGAKLTHMKITGGCLAVRDVLTYTDREGEEVSEKVGRIRVYSGEKARNAEVVVQGEVCAVPALTATFAGQGLGFEPTDTEQILEPVLTYRVIAPKDVDEHTLLSRLRILEDEDPTMAVNYNEQLHEVTAALMGEVQAEVLKRIVSERFGMEIELGEGRIAYRETIAEPVDGAGHFEPLRHYAEVHLRLEPLPRGSGLEFDSDCSEDILSRNWQRLVLTHLKEKTHRGVLTCSPITDMRITLTAGRAHLKHTEGGDFRQATYRAVRQGLRKAKSVLLEPWYAYRLEIPAANVGRALTDLDRMGAHTEPPETDGETAVLTGTAPVSKLRFYHTEVAGYTKGLGRLSCRAAGYDVCLDADEVIAEIGYDPDKDTHNYADSVFCSHGAGHVVPWDEADEQMHVSPETGRRQYQQAEEVRTRAADFVRRAVEDEELMAIFERTYGSINRKKRDALHTPKEVRQTKAKPRPVPTGPEYLLVDGYNIIFAWDDLKKLAAENLDLARSTLINRLSSFQGCRGCELIIVFDAYRVKEPEHIDKAGSVSVVYTKEAETADTYIERTAHQLAKEHRVTVATSDGLEQVIIMGSGARRMSASDLKHEVEASERAVRDYIEKLNRRKLK
ncbi:MAG: TetM/TetW/TetO/TetS family tetracycline resistance ribosomal protection protein [Ruminococcus sp.]|uniref:translation factor GTPase family protein n=1 Tax=Ruminococcus sp. TaxID=41978 RepID=UPI0025F51794|nr:TetM/TetW/TetO/TetS family tetracycline resistance ribosomal protection protein [Ruminococcus sp.]MCR5542479.1 TetM/TetW/TetO/TetS family tetracycline resistance ribosomal protection protein [Ruminococcus sp.]